MSHFPPLRTVAVADTRYYKFVGECRQCGDGAGGKVVNLLLFAALVALWIGVNRFLCESLESLDVRACAHRTRISIHAHHNTRTQTGLLGVRPDEQRDRKLQRQVASRLQRIRAAHIFRLGLRCRHHQFRCRPRLDCAALCHVRCVLASNYGWWCRMRCTDELAMGFRLAAGPSYRRCR